MVMLINGETDSDAAGNNNTPNFSKIHRILCVFFYMYEEQLSNIKKTAFGDIKTYLKILEKVIS